LKHQQEGQRFYKEFCDKVISLDPSIRFAGIVDAEGKLLGISERKALIPLLTPEQRAQYAITAATRQFTRLRWEHHLGKIHYASSHYAKLIRATIPITDTESQLWYVLILTFDVASSGNVHELITKRIIPVVSENTSQLITEMR
jgi:hypothetical protein